MSSGSFSSSSSSVCSDSGLVGTLLADNVGGGKGDGWVEFAAEPYGVCSLDDIDGIGDRFRCGGDDVVEFFDDDNVSDVIWIDGDDE